MKNMKSSHCTAFECGHRRMCRVSNSYAPIENWNASSYAIVRTTYAFYRYVNRKSIVGQMAVDMKPALAAVTTQCARRTHSYPSIRFEWLHNAVCETIATLKRINWLRLSTTNQRLRRWRWRRRWAKLPNELDKLKRCGEHWLPLNAQTKRTICNGRNEFHTRATNAAPPPPENRLLRKWHRINLPLTALCIDALMLCIRSFESSILWTSRFNINNNVTTTHWYRKLVKVLYFVRFLMLPRCSHALARIHIVHTRNGNSRFGGACASRMFVAQMQKIVSAVFFYC